jgi:hypothetical protein
MAKTLLTLYVIKGNSDQTEGRGRQLDREIYTDLDIAAKVVTSGEAKSRWGVMGVGEVELHVRSIIEEDGLVSIQDNMLYGYRRDWRGNFNYGWVDNRDAPVNDPDYAEYLRLKEKFERNS